MSNLRFNPSTTTRKLINQLPERAQDVIRSRYGLHDDAEVQTLESIGERYGITRERVRQIEASSLNKLRESSALEQEASVFDELHELFHELGVILPEDVFLNHVSDERHTQNHVYLLLDLGPHFEREKENDHLHHRWHVDARAAAAVHRALERLHQELDKDDLVDEQKIIKWFVEHIDDFPSNHAHHVENEEVLRRWLALSKKVGKNPLGEWGLTSSPNVRVKGVRDYAYLVIRRHGSPLHFREVTEKIEDLFDKEAHVATTHNELIKDERFVLVGRGLYALKEWGYITGVVREVIQKILEKHGPLTRDEVVDKVLKERYVKENTIVVNLQNDEYFTKTDDNRYTVNS